MKTMILAAHQPNFLPWTGFFHKMMACDSFVILDKSQFVKNALFNRNKIKTHQGSQYLTVPVHLKSHLDHYDEVLIDNSRNRMWTTKFLRTLELAYKKSPFFHQYYPGLREIFLTQWTHLIELNLALIFFITESLGIKTRLLFESNIEPSGRSSCRLVSICMKSGASTYLSGDGSPYLEEHLFLQEGINVRFQNFSHPVYPQINGDFVSHLSAIDMLFNCGPQSSEIILQQNPKTSA